MKINSWFFQMSHLSTFDTKQKFLTAFIPGVICWTRKTLNLKKRSKMGEVNRSTFSCFTFNLKKVVHFLLNSYLIGGVFISIPMPNNRNISSKRERERERERERWREKTTLFKFDSNMFIQKFIPLWPWRLEVRKKWMIWRNRFQNPKYWFKSSSPDEYKMNLFLCALIIWLI